MEIDAEPKLILASASPRRRQLLRLIGLPHRVDPARVEEAPVPGEPAGVYAVRAARDKAAEVVARRPGLPVMGADTVVELDGSILGKPGSTADARRMLRSLSGRAHRVHSAVALITPDGRRADLVDATVVRFLPLDDAMIDWYLATGEAMDKAGAYGVQGAAGLFVAGLEGSPHTVVGLPIHRLDELLGAVGLSLWSMLSPRP